MKIIAFGKRQITAQISALAKARSDIQLSAVLDEGEIHMIHTCTEREVVIHFGDPDSTEQMLQVCEITKHPLVIGVFGHTEAQKRRIEVASRIIPIVHNSNMSVGINILFWLTELIAKVMGREFDCEIVATHGRGKKNAPSGTALRLFEILSQACEALPSSICYGRREGSQGRLSEEIGIHSVRGGNVPGEYEVRWLGDAEEFKLTHRTIAPDEMFARGAVLAAEWLSTQPSGLYTMADVLGFSVLDKHAVT